MISYKKVNWVYRLQIFTNFGFRASNPDLRSALAACGATSTAW